MNVRPEAIELAQIWMRKAAGDLKNAEHTLTLSDQECPFETVCFHAQQCAEKSLKAFLTFHGVFFRKIHDLSELLELCNQKEPFSSELDALGTLSSFAVETRYPEMEAPPDRPRAEQAVSLARKTHELIRHRLAPMIG